MSNNSEDILPDKPDHPNAGRGFKPSLEYIIKSTDRKLEKPSPIIHNHYEIGQVEDNINEARRIIEEELIRYGFPQKKVENFSMAVVEGAQNVYEHTNLNNKKYHMMIETLMIGDQYFAVGMRGEGPGKFDIEKVEGTLRFADKVLKGEATFGTGGMGLHIMRTICDDLGYKWSDEDQDKIELWMGIYR